MIARFFAAFIVAIGMLTLVGCGRAPVPTSDQGTAKQLLGSSFEAWKTGKSVADMRQLTPPVYVAEEIWNGGFELHDFAIEGDGEMYGHNVRLNVILTGSSKVCRMTFQPNYSGSCLASITVTTASATKSIN